MKATTSIHQDLIENIIKESKRLVKENAILERSLTKLLKIKHSFYTSWHGLHEKSMNKDE